MTDLLMLQGLRFKGRLGAESAAAFSGVDPVDAQALLEWLVSLGLAKEAGTAFRLTPEGKQRLGELVREEASTVDRGSLEERYHAFDDHNNELKATMAAWQMKDADTPNDHADADYDQAVVARLTALHRGFAPLLDEIVELAPRLRTYATRLAHAAQKVREGEHAFVARPIIDSYHTVWFELHEELIGLLGRTRAEEAAAGRAV